LSLSVGAGVAIPGRFDRQHDRRRPADVTRLSQRRVGDHPSREIHQPPLRIEVELAGRKRLTSHQRPRLVMKAVRERLQSLQGEHQLAPAIGRRGVIGACNDCERAQRRDRAQRALWTNGHVASWRPEV
jgi:hypothetical protein